MISSSPHEAAGRTVKHEKDQRQRDREEEERVHSLHHVLVSRTDLLSTGDSLLGCVYILECVCIGLHSQEKKRDS